MNKISNSIPVRANLEERSMVCSFGNLLRKLPISAVISIEPIGKIAPIPFGAPPFEGLMSSVHGTAPVFNYGSHLGEKNCAGKYCLVVQTPKGIIRLRVDSVVSLNADTRSEYEKVLCAQEEIEAMLSNYDVAANIEPVIQEKTAFVETRSILVLQTNADLVAFDIEGITFIERHKEAKAIDAANRVQRIVTLQNEQLVCGKALNNWLNEKDSNPRKEAWSIGYLDSGDTCVVTTQNILGIEQVNIQQFNSVKHNGKSEIWINHPKHGALRVLNVECFKSESSDSITNGLIDQTKNREYKAHQEKTTSHSINNAGVGISFEQFKLVLPTNIISHINSRKPGSKPQKKPYKHSLPAFDLSAIAEFEDKKTQVKSVKRAITIKSSAKEEIVFLTSNIYEPNKEASWEPLPLLPQSLGKLVNAIRIADGQCELLLKPSALSNPPPEPLQKIAKTAFCGWINPSL